MVNSSKNVLHCLTFHDKNLIYLKKYEIFSKMLQKYEENYAAA